MNIYTKATPRRTKILISPVWNRILKIWDTPCNYVSNQNCIFVISKLYFNFCSFLLCCEEQAEIKIIFFSNLYLFTQIYATFEYFCYSNLFKIQIFKIRVFILINIFSKFHKHLLSFYLVTKIYLHFFKKYQQCVLLSRNRKQSL